MWQVVEQPKGEKVAWTTLPHEGQTDTEQEPPDNLWRQQAGMPPEQLIMEFEREFN